MGRTGIRQRVLRVERSGVVVKESSSTRGGGRVLLLLTLACGHHVLRRDRAKQANCGICRPLKGVQ